MATKQKTRERSTRKPVACFYYQGTHSHPVRRLVFVIAETKHSFTGFELREGSVTRTLNQAMSHIKTYSKNKIARWGDYSRLRASNPESKDPNKSTLRRFSLQRFMQVTA